MGNASAFFSSVALLLPLVSAGQALVDPCRFVRHPIAVFEQIHVDTYSGSQTEAPPGVGGGERAFATRALDLCRPVRAGTADAYPYRSFNPEIVRAGAHERQPMRPGTMVTDPFITAQVKTLLLRRSILKDLDIQVETKNGVVRLSGVVQNEEQVVQALEAASEAEGVKTVINALVVKS